MVFQKQIPTKTGYLDIRGKRSQPLGLPWCFLVLHLIIQKVMSFCRPSLDTIPIPPTDRGMADGAILTIAAPAGLVIETSRS